MTTAGRYPSGRCPGRPRKSPLGMTASRIQVASDRDTRAALEALLLAWRVADIDRNVSRADVIRELILWAAQQVKAGDPGFLPRKRRQSG